MSADVESLIGRLSALDTCAVSDALDSLGLPGASSIMLPVWDGAKLAGRTVTVTVRPVDTHPTPSAVHLGVTAIEQASRGDIVVVDNEGRSGMGAWGGLLTSAAMARQVGGVVVYGACRDVDEVRELGFPVFSVARSVRTARGRVVEVACGEPVEIDGVTVEPNDLVLADGTGVVFLPASRAEEIVARAEAFVTQEATMRAAIRAGLQPAQVLAGNYEQMLDAQ